MTYAPIGLFAYNRPEHVARALRALAANPELAESPITIFCDGPKSDTGRAKTDAARKAAREHAPSHATFVERDVNQGLARSMRAGVTELCEQYGRAIVIEDDLEPSPTFLRFMNLALDRYADDEKVMQVSGYQWPIDVRGSDDALFLPMISTWGWGVWARSWAKLDSGAPFYDRMKSDADLRRRFDFDGAFPYFDMLRSQRLGEIDSWGIRWNLDVFANDGLVLYPRKSLIANRGHDGSGTHREASSPFESDAHPFIPHTLPTELRLDPPQVDQLRDFVRDVSRGTMRNRVGRFLVRAKSTVKTWVRR